MKRRGASALLLMATLPLSVLAQEQQQAPADPNKTTEETTRPPVEVPYRGPLASLGTTLNDAGLYPIIVAGYSYVTNNDMGFVKHSSQTGEFLLYGFDYNVPPSIGLKGTSLHFTTAGTRRTDTSFFGDAGDPIVSNAASNLPRKDHLTRATLMQTFDDGRYFAEAGKGYANDYMARPVCNNAYTCMSVIDGTHKLAGVNFPNYSNWFGRVGMNVSEKLKVQAAGWEYSTASAGFNTAESGWETWEHSYKRAWFADAQYADNAARYPSSAEAMFFYNKIPQTDSIYGTTANPTPTRHQSGLFGSLVETVWRPSTGPTMLQAFGSGAVAFNSRQTQNPYTAGYKYAVDVGFKLKAPFASRPFDVYSLQYSRVGLTDDEQTLLKNRGYGNGSAENAMALSANFRLHDYVFFQPYVQYIWDVQASSYLTLAGLSNFVPSAPTVPTGQKGKGGFAFGLVFVIPFDRLLGLTTRSSGYDGHYP